MKEFVIGPNDAGQRVDKFLTKAVPLLPSSLLYKSIRLKRIKLNGKRCQISTRLTEGDRLELYLRDEFFAREEGPLPFLRAKDQLQIVYEDENILLVNKEAGLLVHEDDQEKADTLINRILKYLYGKGEYRPLEENSFVPALCNRIDRNTSGIVIAAKNAPTLRVLNEKIKERQLDKRYLCIVFGAPQPPQATLKGWLVKDADANQVEILPAPREGARTILTRYTTLETRGRFSLLEVELLTGRTHQIRAHLASIGHPLLGDTKYGRNRDNKGTGWRWQALCSYRLTFSFTTDGEHLNYLNGRTFQVEKVDFADAFRAGRIV